MVKFEMADPVVCGEMTVTATIAGTNGGTYNRAVHDKLPPGLSSTDDETGWRMVLDKLAVLGEAG